MVGQAYVVPSYQAPEDTSWYHFLHGNVPGHQIDFMYRPEVPQGQLTRQHFSHLSRLMKYIEPQTNAPFAFAIGNLSRDDTQYVPGHGGVALIFGLRIRGTTDHAGRQDPPFAHAIAAVDRDLDYTSLVAAATAFHRHVLVAAETAEWYRAYVRCATESPVDVEHVLAGYVESFRGLPEMPWSSMSAKWLTGGANQPKRIVIVHENEVPFDSIAHCAARIAAMLYRSDIRWTSISNGREADLPNGVSIRLIAERDFAPTDATENVRRLRDVPEDEAELAAQLFGAKSADAGAKPAMVGWRDRYEGDAPGRFDPAAAEAALAGGLEATASGAGAGHGFRRASERPPPMGAGSEVARRSRPEAGPGTGDNDPTHAWGEVSAKTAAAIVAEEEEEIPVDLETLTAGLVPAAASAPMQETPARLPPVMSSGAGAMPPPVHAAPPMVQAGTPMNGMGARPATGPGGTRVMSYPQAVASPLAPAPPAVAPPAAAPPAMAVPPQVPGKTDTDWEPTPNFRKPSSPRLLWVIVILVVGVAGVAGWVLLSEQGTSTDPVTSGGEPTAPVPSPDTSAPPSPTSLPTSASAAPSARPTAGPAKGAPPEDSGKPKPPVKPGGTGRPKPGNTTAPIIGGPAVF